jgi:hypothetical protein
MYNINIFSRQKKGAPAMTQCAESGGQSAASFINAFFVDPTESCMIKLAKHEGEKLWMTI